MKAILRSALVAAGVATALATSVLPANAVGAGEFEGFATISCFGCGGTQPGTAELAVNGVNGTTPVVGAVILPGQTGNVHAAYTVIEGTGTDCVIQGQAFGTTTGAVNTAFTWSRFGAVAIISTTGDINGPGVAAFVVTTAGLPCGTNNLQALVVGALAGT